MFVDRSLKINSTISRAIACGQNGAPSLSLVRSVLLRSEANWIAACALMPTTINTEKNMYVIAIIRILSLRSLLFGQFFSVSLWDSVCDRCCVMFFFSLVIFLITHTKWFIKISLRTRYMLVCGPDSSWYTLQRPMHRRAWKITFAVVFSAHRPNGEKSALFVVAVVVFSCWTSPYNR